MHIIDISDPTNPDVIGFVDTPCGSHTETLVPDLANNRLLVYSNPSANTIFGVAEPGEEPLNCRGMDIIEVPLGNPAAASYLRFVPSGDPTEPVDGAPPLPRQRRDPRRRHEGRVRGRPRASACYSLDPADGGSLDDPMFLHHIEMPAACGIGHSASFTLGRRSTLIFGHEPGGGGQARVPGARARDRSSGRSSSSTWRPGRCSGTFLHPAAADGCRELHAGTTSTSCRPTRATSWSPGTTSPASRVIDFTDGEREGDRIRRSGAARRPEPAGRHRARRRLVDLLVRRLDLRVRHHAWAHDVEPQRQRGRRGQEARPSQPADAGVHHRLRSRAQPTDGSRVAAERRPPSFLTGSQTGRRSSRSRRSGRSKSTSADLAPDASAKGRLRPSLLRP